MKTFVLQIATKASAHRETLQAIYDNQVQSLKGVIAEYFEKYEGKLALTAETLRTMERQQQEWIDKLLKPQPEGHARLFALETRLSEQEMRQQQSHLFIKDLLKKFVYALE